MQTLETNITLTGCYAGLVDVVGGKMWYVHNMNVITGEAFSPLYFTTKREAVAAVRRIYKPNADMRNAVLNQINRSHGRACFYA